MAQSKTQGIPNLDPVVNPETPITPTTSMNPVMTDAYEAHAQMDKHMQDVKTELEEKGAEIQTESPSTNEKKMPKNTYTKKLTLKEDMEDFNLQSPTSELKKGKDGRSHRQSTRDENDGNKFLDYDMFTFVHELFAGQNCNTNPAPKTPKLVGVRIVNRKTGQITYSDAENPRNMRKFLDSGVDSQKADKAYRDRGLPQVAIDINNNIIISAPEKEDLIDVIKACEYYPLECGEIEAAKSASAYWPWRITVKVPLDSRGNPMLLSDWLDLHGLKVEDVMYPDFAKAYNKAKMKADTKEQTLDDLLNNQQFNDIFNKAIITAANDDSPLKDHANQLVKDCKAAGLTFKRQDVIDLFMAEFEEEY